MAETVAATWHGPWNTPDVESIDLYPGLVVHDGRVTGSITVGESRLPLWAFAGWDWDEVVHGWDYIETDYEWTREKQCEFLYSLLNLRGDFARLLLVMADAERIEHNRGAPFSGPKNWWETKKHRKRVGDALRRCLEVLEHPYGPEVTP
jgi:hypothetical protein